MYKVVVDWYPFLSFLTSLQRISVFEIQRANDLFQLEARMFLSLSA